MTKAKYKKGRRIDSLDDLVKQSIVWYICRPNGGGKTVPKCWFLSFQLNFILNQITRKRIYTAELIEGGADNDDTVEPMQGVR